MQPSQVPVVMFLEVPATLLAEAPSVGDVSSPAWAWFWSQQSTECTAGTASPHPVSHSESLTQHSAACLKLLVPLSKWLSFRPARSSSQKESCCSRDPPWRPTCVWLWSQ